MSNQVDQRRSTSRDHNRNNAVASPLRIHQRNTALMVNQAWSLEDKNLRGIPQFSQNDIPKDKSIILIDDQNQNDRLDDYLEADVDEDRV